MVAETLDRWRQEGFAGNTETLLDLLDADLAGIGGTWPSPFPGQTQTIHAIVDYLRVSQVAFDGNGQGLLAGYSHYLAARNELFKIVGGDGNR